jgi:hypothetical protein
MFISAPSNLGIIHKVIMLILTFEVIPGEVYQQYIWNWFEEKELENRFQAVGLDSKIFMLSMGLPFYVFSIALLPLAIALVITCCAKKSLK